VTVEWAQRNELSGWAAHWQRGDNFASSFDDWFLRQLPIYSPYVNGLTTLNFVPTLATMILGLMAGEMVASQRAPAAKVRWLLLAGFAGLVTGGFLHLVGVNPIVKSLWTPSWVLFSGGWCFLTLAFFYYIVDIRGMRTIVFPLVVIGMNSLVAYVMSYLYPHFAFGAFRRVLGSDVFKVLGASYEPLLYGSAILVSYWLALYVLYRRNWFVRI
jgi:predicted acyltransferase